MASVLVPVAYIIIVFGSLLIFSYYYRKHAASQPLDSYFGPHVERNTYVTLLQKTDPPASDALLKAALVRRAIADVQRVIRIREDKPALQNLLQKGSIGDDLWNSLLAAEKELEGEVMEVVAEANSFVEGWGQVIFPTANEVIANERNRALFEKTAETKAELESRYDTKAKDVSEVPTLQLVPPPAAPPVQPPPAAIPAPIIPPSPSASSSTNGLHPSPSGGTESVLSSDGEAASPKSPSKNAKSKKNKKRK